MLIGKFIVLLYKMCLVNNFWRLLIIDLIWVWCDVFYHYVCVIVSGCVKIVEVFKNLKIIFKTKHK